MKQERRTFTGTVIARAEGEGMPKVIGGIAAVINSVTDLGYFEEVIEAGAFDYALGKEYDIRCLFNHEAELILGRTKASTCNVFVNADGNLEYTSRICTTLARLLIPLTLTPKPTLAALLPCVIKSVKLKKPKEAKRLPMF